ncbi:hypothetical protein F2Q69_00060178 [Brassica cretica]|uniref:Uncharacterized protein n=1 Tax=Brassica cretica TaxID=69181 RepID=A0A8S9RPU6_BRACR|nr:hypothetical protein F2Q69_00060178 [Brassica cretica]
MAKKCNSRGKDISDETAEVEDVKAALSERLFATDRYPCERVNMYSTIDNLLWVYEGKGMVRRARIVF